MKHIKLFEDHLNEGLSEKAQQFIKICELVTDKNKTNPAEVQQLIIDHGWSNAKLKDMIQKLEQL
jgi:oligoribonuclease (3'-5' exoribonuclease)